MIKYADVVVKDMKFRIHLFLGMEGWKLQLKVAKIIAPAVKELFANQEKQEVVGCVVERLVSSLVEADENGTLVLQLLSRTTFDDNFINLEKFNELFVGDYGTIIMLLFEVIKQNDFLCAKNFGALDIFKKNMLEKLGN